MSRLVQSGRRREHELTREALVAPVGPHGPVRPGRERRRLPVPHRAGTRRRRAHAEARTAYADVLEFWKTADRDLPIVIEASKAFTRRSA